MATQTWEPGDSVFFKEYRSWKRGTVESIEDKRHFAQKKPTRYINVIPAEHECKENSDTRWCYHPSIISRRDHIRPANDPEIMTIVERKESEQQRENEAEEQLTREYAEIIFTASHNVDAVVAVLKSLRPNLQINPATIRARTEEES